MRITLPLKKASGEVIAEREVEFNSLRVGTVKRIFRVIDVDQLMKECKNSNDVYQYLMGRVCGMSEIMEDVIKSLFSLTDEEFLEQVELDDLAGVIHIILAESMRRLQATEEGLKNLLRAEQ